jgi:hypothetical protein
LKYRNELLERSSNAWAGAAATESQVAEVEVALGALLPRTYRAFLLSVGAAAIGDNTISGIIDGNPLCRDGGSLYGDTLRGRDELGLPHALAVIQWNDEAPYCLDVSTAQGDECPVVCFQRNTRSYRLIAADFDDWFSRFFLAVGT